MLDDDGAAEKNGRPRCHKRPKSREETPKEGSDSAGGGYRMPLVKTIAISGSIERKDHGPIRRFMALALEADHFRKGSNAALGQQQSLVRSSPHSGLAVKAPA